jgi:hypothetical protein
VKVRYVIYLRVYYTGCFADILHEKIAGEKRNADTPLVLFPTAEELWVF